LPVGDDSQHDGPERVRHEREMLSARSTTASTSLCGSAPWTGWLVAVMAGTVLLFGIDILFHPLPAPVSELFQKFASCWVFFGAAALCMLKGRTAGGERFAWWLFALAMTLWGTAALYFAVFQWNLEEVPFPSVADGFWLAFYLPAYAALYKLLRKWSGSASRGVWLDALVGGLGVGGGAAALVFGVVLANATGTAAAIATNLAYPVGDLGLLVLVVTAITITGWKAAGVWRWIAAAFVTFAVADSIYVVQIAAGSYTVGGILDLGWPAAALLVGVAAWRGESRVRPSVPKGTAIVVPAVVGFAALALLVGDHFVGVNLLALALATAAIIVILVRLYLTVKDNARLLTQSRREAMTDALTGLGNRRQLMADLTVHLDDLDPERPLMLTLFDLDGFKEYNDTFGHLAGDQLLERLGARLRNLLAGHGTAYRMGGDEFCGLWDRSHQGSVTSLEAVAALSEQGEAFTIGCSYGSVLLPMEATDPIEALGMADRRMYIRKRSGRASAGRQSANVLLRTLAERDSELGIHLGGVADLASATAMRLGVPQEHMEAVRQTGLLHDVGKVAIPDEILSKPGPLDESEWAFMKRHTIIGERIISAAPALTVVARLVRSTHERYDGGGYPDGLAGDDIPLIARIVTVCDAYDAMVTKRAYRDAWDKPTAIAELRNCSGTQFDPEVVEAFVSALETVGDRGQVAAHSLEPDSKIAGLLDGMVGGLAGGRDPR
jgi:two-component system, cell cycle response regulator